MKYNYTDILIDINFELSQGDEYKKNNSFYIYVIILGMLSIIYCIHNVILSAKIISFTINSKRVYTYKIVLYSFNFFQL